MSRHKQPRRNAELVHVPKLTPRQQMEEHWYSEEIILLTVNKQRLFRAAVLTGSELSDMPDFEAEVLAELDLTDAFAELDEARDGADHVTAEIAKWREELAGAGG